MFEKISITNDGYLMYEAISFESGIEEMMNINHIIEHGHPYNLSQLARDDFYFFEEPYTGSNFGTNIMALTRVIVRRKLCRETKAEMKTALQFLEAAFTDVEAPPQALKCARRLIDHLYLSDNELYYYDDLFVQAMKKRSAALH